MKLSTIGLLAVALLTTGCQTQPETRAPSKDTIELVSRFENKLAARLFDEAFDELLAMNPEHQTRYGIHDNDDKWTPISREHSARQVDLLEAHWRKIKKSIDVEKLTRQNRLSYQLFEYNARMARQDLEFWWYWYPVNQMHGRHSAMPAFLINIHPGRNVADLENYISRLEGIEAQLDELIELMKAQETLGIMQPQFVYAHAIENCRNILKGSPFDASGDDSPLLEDFIAKVKRLELNTAETNRLIDKAGRTLLNHVAPGYGRLIAYLQSAGERARGDTGVWRLPQGDAYYSHLLRNYTTTDLTPAEVHELGLSEVKRIQGEMRDIMEKVSFDGSLQDFFHSLRNDDRFFLENTEAGRQAYLDIATDYIAGMRDALPKVVGTMPQSDLIIKAVEPYRETSAGKAFYSRPSPKGDRPGIVYLNLHDVKAMPVYELEALAYHEGIPGHHLQNAIAVQLDDIPKFRRFGNFTAYSEGWGLYAEYFPREFGFYDDPYSDFGRLTAELWRAARLVVDTGLHYKRWSREAAIRYLDENTPFPHAQAVKATERYLVMPGQATAYKVGMLKILEVRARSEAVLGDRFDLPEFHDVILENGPLPLSFLERVVDEWLETRSDTGTQESASQ